MKKSTLLIGLVFLILILLGGWYLVSYQAQKAKETQEAIADGTLIFKKEWGVSFAKNAKYVVAENSSARVLLNEPIEEERISIEYVTGDRVATQDAKFGPTTIWYDEQTEKWMRQSESLINGAFHDAAGPLPSAPAEPNFYTADNLPVFQVTGRWLTYIVPLSHTTFLKMNITGSGVTQPLEVLAKSLKKT